MLSTVTLRTSAWLALALIVSGGCSDRSVASDCEREMTSVFARVSREAPNIQLDAFQKGVSPGCQASDIFLLRRAELLHGVGDNSGARSVLSKVGRGSGFDDRIDILDFQLILAERPIREEDATRARATATRFVQKHPNHFRGHMMLGVARILTNDDAGALESYDTARALAPGIDDPEFEALEVYYLVLLFNTDRDADVYRVLKRQMELGVIGWDRVDLILVGAYSTAKIGKKDEAKVLLDELVKRHPQVVQDPVFREAVALIQISE